MSRKAVEVILLSKDRQNYNDPNVTASNFLISLQNSIIECNKISLLSVVIPNTFYNISDIRDNDNIIINGIILSIPEGNYNLTDYLNELQSAINTFYGLAYISITYDTKTSLVTFQKLTPGAFILEMPAGTADMLGFLGFYIYGGDTTYSGYKPPNLAPLGIYINIDIITNSVSSSTQAFNSATFFVSNTTNQQEYIQFFANTMFHHSTYYPRPISIGNSMKISLYDTQGFPLQNVGEWVMVLGFEFDKKFI